MVKRALYCGGPSVGLRDWVAAGRSHANLSDTWPQLLDRTVIGTYRGRTAIALACRLLGIGVGDDILVPSYNCGTEIDAILHSGSNIVPYQISRRCEIELADLIRRRTNRTKAVYVIHYFGWEQPLLELRRWCSEQDLLLIEDCALALFSSGPTGSIGRLGDAAIYSLPKSLGFKQGGLLSLPKSPIIPIPPLKASSFVGTCEEIGNSFQKYCIKTLDNFGFYGCALSMRAKTQKNKPACSIRDSGQLPDIPHDYYFNAKQDAIREIRPLVLATASSLPWQEIKMRRCANFRYLQELTKQLTGIHHLREKLDHGVCPLAYPMLVSNRQNWVSSLNKRGIDALPWWAGFHRGAIDWHQFSDAVWLKKQLFTIPIHHQLDEAHIRFLANTLGETLRTIETKVSAMTFDSRPI